MHVCVYTYVCMYIYIYIHVYIYRYATQAKEGPLAAAAACSPCRTAAALAIVE